MLHLWIALIDHADKKKRSLIFWTWTVRSYQDKFTMFCENAGKEVSSVIAQKVIFSSLED